MLLIQKVSPMRLHRLTPGQFVQFCRQFLTLEGYTLEMPDDSLSGTTTDTEGATKHVILAPYRPLGKTEPNLPDDGDGPVLLLHNFSMPPQIAGEPRVETWGQDVLTTKARAYPGLLESFPLLRALTVRQLELESFRGFEKLQLRFGENVTVLINATCAAIARVRLLQTV